MSSWTVRASAVVAAVVLGCFVSPASVLAGFGQTGYICGVGHSADKSLASVGSVGASGYLSIDLTTQPNCQGTYYMVAACSAGATSSFCTARFSEAMLTRHLDLLREAQEKQTLVYMYLTEAMQGDSRIYNPRNFFYYK